MSNAVQLVSVMLFLAQEQGLGLANLLALINHAKILD
jgi:hypothetical protein